MMLSLIIALSIFSELATFTSSLSFNFTAFNSGNDAISYERSYAANGQIHLTANLANIGRSTYFEPMQLWDNKTNNLTDFNTYFSFSIDSNHANYYGDGLAFFLAPQGSRIPADVTKGGSLGLTKDGQSLNTTANEFVAVEFDVYQNEFDPNRNHVGIDINSMRSETYSNWSNSILDGKVNDAWISYDSISKNLSVKYTGFLNESKFFQYLDYQVDLRDHLPEFVTFGFSAATGNQSAVIKVYSWSFSSSLVIDMNMTNSSHVPNSNDTNTTNPSHVVPNSNDVTKPEKSSNVGLIVGLCVGGIVIFSGLLLFVLIKLWKRRNLRHGNRDVESRDEDDFVLDDDFERGTGPKRFPYKDLTSATNNFDEKEKLGEGGFGSVYRGFLKELNCFVAAKRVSSGSKQGMKEYASEVRIISRLRHRNLVQLLGWCHEKRNLILVYEFLPNKSLDSHLFKSEMKLLTWDARYKIAQGLASAVLYLHEEWEQCVLHRDIKSSNVMLDSNFNAKLGDFGLARLVDHGESLQTAMMAGTMGYMAPEFLTTGKASKETDVYSFGIVALEIACGRRPILHKAQEKQINMVEWVWELYGAGIVLDTADPKLNGDFDQKEMERLMIVGLWCAHPDSHSRPTMKQALQALSFDAPLPILPLIMPVLTYFTPSMKRVTLYSHSASSGQIGTSGSNHNTNFSHYTASSSASASAVVQLE